MQAGEQFRSAVNSCYNSRVNSATLAPPPRLARTATMVMLCFVASRALGLLRDMGISHQFGTARVLDAYWAAFTIPDFVFNVLAGGALASAFIPTFTAALAQNDVQRAWQLARALVTLVFITLTALCALLALGAQPIVALSVARGFTPAEQILTADLMRWMLITPIVFGVSGIVMGILQAHQHFLLPALAPIVYNVAIIGGALWLAPVLGVYGLVVGVVAGALLHLAIQMPWFWERLEIRDWRVSHLQLPISNLQSLISTLHSPDLHAVIRLMLPRMLGIAAVQINFVVNTMLASTLSVGAIAALAYAWRMMLLPVGVIGQSLATVVFPTFAAHAARAERDALSAMFSSAFRVTMYLTIPATAGLVVLGTPLVTLLFQRGQFDAHSTAETVFALRFFALALFAHACLEIVARAFYALHDTFTPVVVGIGAMGLNIALSLLLISPLAHGGLALANSIATTLELGVLLMILQRRTGIVDSARVARATARIVAATVAMTVVLVPFANHFAASPLVSGLGGMVIGAAVYFLATLILRSDEISLVYQRITRKSIGVSANVSVENVRKT